jgi:ABC-type phosphate transport system substrate-binding protein
MKHIAIAALTLLLNSLAMADTIVVIANPKAGFDSLSLAETRQLYLGKNRRLPDAQTAMPVMPHEKSATRIDFERQVLNRDPKQSRAYWAQMIFTGRGTPPRQLDSDEQVKQEVAANPQAIGYIKGRALDKSVKAVLVIEQ